MTTEIQPYDYQEDAINGVFDYWRDNPGEWPLLVMATGAGKTLVFAFIMMRLLREYPGVRVLFLAHRKELVSQSEEKLKAVWPDAPVGVFAAGLNRREIAPITIASRDTIAPAIANMPHYKPDLIVPDEAHNISPKEGTRYRSLLYTLESRNPSLMVLGLTATPFRTNHGRIYGDGEVFSAIAYEIKIRTLIDKGRLAPLVSKQVSDDAKIDTSGVKLVGGEFHQGQLAQVSLNLPMIDAAVDEWIRLAWNTGRRSTLFFCVSIAHAEAVQTSLAMRGHHFELVTGKTATQARTRICNDFASGRTHGIINCAVFTEGTDFPIIDCIANLRSVHSLGLWLQMAGRGMRIHSDPDITDCLVLDFGGCIERFGPIDLAAPPAKRGKPDERTKTCPECNTITGFYKFKCVCGHEFKPSPHKVCDACGEANAPSADKCIACGNLFAKHDTTASTDDIMSSRDKLRTIPVTGDVYCRGMISKSSGKPYLQVLYPASLTKHYTHNLMIGYEGFSGDKALREWDRMTIDGTPAPESVEHACRLADESWPWVFRPVESITVDWSDKYKTIKMWTYKEDES